jgi:hypothetical protein
MKLKDKALVKVLAHSMKYSKSPLLGLLLGHQSNHLLEITDAVPLFHSALYPSTLPIALEQVQAHLDVTQSGTVSQGPRTRILGFYYAPQDLSGGSLKPEQELGLPDFVFQKLSSPEVKDWIVLRLDYSLYKSPEVLEYVQVFKYVAASGLSSSSEMYEIFAFL